MKETKLNNKVMPVQSEKGQQITRRFQRDYGELVHSEKYLREISKTPEKATKRAAGQHVHTMFKREKAENKVNNTTVLPAQKAQPVRKKLHKQYGKGLNTTQVPGVGSVSKYRGAGPSDRSAPTTDWSSLDRGEKIPSEGSQHFKDIKSASTEYGKAYGAYKQGKSSVEKVHEAKTKFFTVEHRTGSANVLRPCATEGCVNPIAKEREGTISKTLGSIDREVKSVNTSTGHKNLKKIKLKPLSLESLKERAPKVDSTLCATCNANEKRIQNKGNALKGVTERQKR